MLPILLAQGNTFETSLSNVKNSGSFNWFNNIRYVDTDTVGKILSDTLPYILVISGLLLFFYLVSGGFDLMTSAGDPKKIEQGKEKITAALIGFVIVFVAFWVYVIITYILGIKI